MDLSHLRGLLYILYVIGILGVIVKIVKDTNSPSKAIGYVLVVIILPVLGVILYFSIGVNYRKERLYEQKLISDKNIYRLLKNRVADLSNERIQNHRDLLDQGVYATKMLLRDSTISALTMVSEVKLLTNGEQKFEEVLKVLKEAKHHIHFEYYIFEDDKIGNIIKDILIQKAKEGVIVRFIYDDFGCHGLRKNMIPQLKEAGVMVAPFYEIKFYALANRLNYRNHRKIIVVDGEIGFIGGINVSDRYINNGDSSRLFWRDTHLMFRGEAINGLQYIFFNDWYFCSKQKIDRDDKYFYTKTIDVTGKQAELVQITASGPDSKRASIMLAYSGIFMSCKERLYLTTPYLIPNETILNAIKFSALSGVDVRVLVPRNSDSALVNAAASAYYEDLLTAGVRIFRYTKGFVHAKTIVADDNLSVIGSANLDMRSFDLNFEISALVYSKRINEELYQAFLEDLSYSDELSLEEWRKRSVWAKTVHSFAKLISPLL